MSQEHPKSQSANLEGLLSPLRVAIRLETEGKRFFSELGARVTGKSAKQTFEFLAGEEDKHIRRIGEFYHALEQSAGARIPEIAESDIHERLARFNDALASLKDEVGSSLSDVEAYRTALKFENGAEEFYLKQIAENDDPHLCQFYSWLVGEEAMHARVLNSCIQFAENPTAWFKNRE